MSSANKDKKSGDGRNKPIPFDVVATAYKNNAGNLSLTAEVLGIDRSTLWEWRKKFPELERMLNDYDESLGDLAESKLMMAINEGNLTAIIFYLKTKHKGRGYIEGQEIRATVSTAIKSMSQEEAAEFIRKLEEEC